MTSINTKTMQELEVRVSSDVFNPQKHLTPKGLAAAIPIKPQVGHHTWPLQGCLELEVLALFWKRDLP